MAESVAGDRAGPPEPAPASASPRLADEYADRHERLDRFIVMYAVPELALARLGIRLHSPLGYGLLVATLVAAILIPVGRLNGTSDDLG
jgi:hypothetical protein